MDASIKNSFACHTGFGYAGRANTVTAVSPAQNRDFFIYSQKLFCLQSGVSARPLNAVTGVRNSVGIFAFGGITMQEFFSRSTRPITRTKKDREAVPSKQTIALVNDIGVIREWAAYIDKTGRAYEKQKEHRDVFISLIVAGHYLENYLTLLQEQLAAETERQTEQANEKAIFISNVFSLEAVRMKRYAESSSSKEEADHV